MCFLISIASQIVLGLYQCHLTRTYLFLHAYLTQYNGWVDPKCTKPKIISHPMILYVSVLSSVIYLSLNRIGHIHGQSLIEILHSIGQMVTTNKSDFRFFPLPSLLRLLPLSCSFPHFSSLPLSKIPTLKTVNAFSCSVIEKISMGSGNRIPPGKPLVRLSAYSNKEFSLTV